MIRNCADSIDNSTGDKLKLSLREFPKSGGMAARVELTHFNHILKTSDLQAIFTARSKHFHQNKYHEGVCDGFTQ